MKLIFPIAAMVALVGAIPTHAGTITDQSPPNLNAINMVTSRTAASFSSFSPFTVDTLNFWYQSTLEGDLANVAWAFYDNNAGMPGTLLYTGVTAPTESVDTDAFFATFTLPDLAFNPGIYWMELHAGPSLTDDTNGDTSFAVWWSNVDGTPARPTVSDYGMSLPHTPVTEDGFQQSAFQLLGTKGPGEGSTVPEPSAFALAAGGVVFLWWRKRNCAVHRA